MHFWIDKRSQGCPYPYRVPLSFSGPSRNQRLLCGGVHPKLMVTPVHRFQSIESVATGGTRHPRGPTYHTRLPISCGPSLPHNASTSRNNATVSHSLEILANGQQHSVTPRHSNTSTGKLKCLVWTFFAIATFFIAGAKYYFHGVIGNMGMEAFVFCSLLGISLFIGGVIALYDGVVNTVSSNDTPQQHLSARVSNEQQETTEINQVPNETTRTAQMNETPPPPYHMAILLPVQRQTNVTIIGDSPPPSYEKAVT